MESALDAGFFYVWSGPDFSHLFRLSVQSVRRLHPSAPITLYVVGPLPANAHFRGVVEDGHATIESIDPLQVLSSLPVEFGDLVAFHESLPAGAHAARSNLLRYALLYLRGGVYLDTDVLVVGSFEHLAAHESCIGLESVWTGDERRVRHDRMVWMSPLTWGWAVTWFLVRVDSLLCAGRLGMAQWLRSVSRLWSKEQANNAVIVSVRGSGFVGRLLAGLTRVDPAVRYSTGPSLVDEALRTGTDDVLVCGPSTFYSVPPGQSFRLFEDVTTQLPLDAVAIHVAASNHARRLRWMDGGNSCARPGSVVGGLAAPQHETAGTTAPAIGPAAAPSRMSEEVGSGAVR